MSQAKGDDGGGGDDDGSRTGFGSVVGPLDAILGHLAEASLALELLPHPHDLGVALLHIVLVVPPGLPPLLLVFALLRAPFALELAHHHRHFLETRLVLLLLHAERRHDLHQGRHLLCLGLSLSLGRLGRRSRRFDRRRRRLRGCGSYKHCLVERGLVTVVAGGVPSLDSDRVRAVALPQRTAAVGSAGRLAVTVAVADVIAIGRCGCCRRARVGPAAARASGRLAVRPAARDRSALGVSQRSHAE